MIWGALMMLIFWGGLVALIVFLVRGSRTGPSQSDEDMRRGPDAREILAERFARGEISEDEFEQRMRVLSNRTL